MSIAENILAMTDLPEGKVTYDIVCHDSRWTGLTREKAGQTISICLANYCPAVTLFQIINGETRAVAIYTAEFAFDEDEGYDQWTHPDGEPIRPEAVFSMMPDPKHTEHNRKQYLEGVEMRRIADALFDEYGE